MKLPPLGVTQSKQEKHRAAAWDHGDGRWLRHWHQHFQHMKVNLRRYLLVTIQPFVQLANLLSQLLQIVGLVQDVRIQLKETSKDIVQYKCYDPIRKTCDSHKYKQFFTCSQDSSRLRFMLANRLFSSSTSPTSFLSSIYTTQKKNHNNVQNTNIYYQTKTNLQKEVSGGFLFKLIWLKMQNSAINTHSNSRV